MKTKNSLKGKLIKIVVENFLKKILFESTVTLKSDLQEELNKYLTFVTSVGEIETHALTKRVSYMIFFQDESG